MNFVKVAMCATAVLLPTTLVQAQELKPLRETLASLGEDTIRIEYAFTRCAALADGAMMFGGLNYPTELHSMLTVQSNVFAAAASFSKLLRAHNNGMPVHDRSTYEKQVNEQTMRIAKIYSDRMHMNSDTTGNSVSGDPLISADMALCKELRPLAEDVVNDSINDAQRDGTSKSSSPNSQASAQAETGICSYHTSDYGWRDIKLRSKSSCTREMHNGTGFWVTDFRWKNGNKVTYVMDGGDGQAGSVAVETINGSIVLETGSTNGKDQCWLVKEGRGFSATCFEPSR